MVMIQEGKERSSPLVKVYIGMNGNRLIGGVNCRDSIRDQWDHHHEAFMVVREAVSVLVSACLHGSHARHCLLVHVCSAHTKPCLLSHVVHIPMVLQLMASHVTDCNSGTESYWLFKIRLDHYLSRVSCLGTFSHSHLSSVFVYRNLLSCFF